MLDAAMLPGGALAATAEVLRVQGRYPGFGHPLYVDGDPRARAMLELLRRAVGGSRAMAVVDDVVAAAQRRAPIHPNVDFAVAALGLATGMPDDAGEIVFTVARVGRVAGPRHRGVRRGSRPVPAPRQLRAGGWVSRKSTGSVVAR